MRTLRGKSTYANVISTLCLFMLLGGGAYAASQLPRNSVGAKQIQNGSITGKEIKNGSIGANKLFSTGVIPLPRRGRDTLGLRGPAGPQGIQGAQGPQGTTNSGAYATVASGGIPEFVGAHPGFAAIERVQEGIVCLTPTPGTDVSHPIASVDLGNSGAVTNAKLAEPFGSGVVEECDAGQLEVWTFELFGDPLKQERSDSVAFTVFAPIP